MALLYTPTQIAQDQNKNLLQINQNKNILFFPLPNELDMRKIQMLI